MCAEPMCDRMTGSFKFEFCRRCHRKRDERCPGCGWNVMGLYQCENSTCPDTLAFLSGDYDKVKEAENERNRLDRKRKSDDASTARKFIKKEYGDVKKNSSCSICFEDFEDTDAIVTIGDCASACDSIYHRACIKHWFDTGDTLKCPVCQK